MKNCIVDVPGILAGHWQDQKAKTGCTVILCPEGAVGGVDVRGGAPGTRETDLLKPGCLVEKVNAVLLTGGSAFGLDAAGGVMKYLEGIGQGMDVGVARVPIVPAAVLFDLGVGDAAVRPDAAAGQAACRAAGKEALLQGPYGAGCGATVGKAFGPACAMPGGFGSASMALPGGGVIGAAVAVNALGDIVDKGRIVAGARGPRGFIDTAAALMAGGPAEDMRGRNTTIGVLATDIKLDKARCARLSYMAHDALGMTVSPPHTLHDGDTFFSLSTGERELDFTILSAAAVEVMRRAILRAVGAGE
nr:P1 family peptidase [bacterium]